MQRLLFDSLSCAQAVLRPSASAVEGVAMLFWVSAKEPKLGYHTSETRLLTRYPY